MQLSHSQPDHAEANGPPPGYPVPPPAWPPPPPPPRSPSRRDIGAGVGASGIIAILAVVLLVVAGGGYAYHHFMVEPGREMAGLADVVDNAGTPNGFSRTSRLDTRARVADVTYELHCEKGVCPVNYVKEVFVWATGLGMTGFTLDAFDEACWPDSRGGHHKCGGGWTGPKGYLFHVVATAIVPDGKDATVRTHVLIEPP